MVKPVRAMAVPPVKVGAVQEMTTYSLEVEVDTPVGYPGNVAATMVVIGE